MYEYIILHSMFIYLLFFLIFHLLNLRTETKFKNSLSFQWWMDWMWGKEKTDKMHELEII